MGRVDRSHSLCANCRSPLLGHLAGLFRESNAFAAEDDAGTGATEIDLEEQAAGYQAAYSKLATAGTPARDLRGRLCGRRTRACRKGVHAVAWGGAGDEDICGGGEWLVLCEFWVSAVLYDNEEGVGEAMAILSKRGISMV